MAIANNLTTTTYASGSVYERKVAKKESLQAGKDGSRTITWDWIFIADQRSEKKDIWATDAFQETIAPFILSGFSFFTDSVDLQRVEQNYGTRPLRVQNAYTDAVDDIGSEVAPQVMGPVCKWVATIVYKAGQGTAIRKQENDRNPLVQKKSDLPPTITWNSNKFELGTTSDVYNQTYQNTAGDYFEGISRPVEERIYTIKLNVPVPGINPAQGNGEPKTYATIATEVEAMHANGTVYEPAYLNSINYTNVTPVVIRGKYWTTNTVRVSNVSVGELQIDRLEVYYEVSITLACRWWGWQREVANRGNNEIRYIIKKGTFISPEVDELYPAGFPQDDQPVHTAEFNGYVDLARSVAGNNIGDLTNEQVFNSPVFMRRDKVPVTDEKGRPLRNPVFLDGYGQADKTAAIAPGIVGSIQFAKGELISNASFNVYAFLGQKLTLASTGEVLYVPETAEKLRNIHTILGEQNAQAMYDAGVSNRLPNLINTGSPVGAAGVTGMFPKAADANGTSDVVLTPGIILTFQDYLAGDLTVLPGVYAAQ